jgi:hypothetical protein
MIKCKHAVILQRLSKNVEFNSLIYYMQSIKSSKSSAYGSILELKQTLAMRKKLSLLQHATTVKGLRRQYALKSYARHELNFYRKVLRKIKLKLKFRSVYMYWRLRKFRSRLRYRSTRRYFAKLRPFYLRGVLSVRKRYIPYSWSDDDDGTLAFPCYYKKRSRKTCVSIGLFNA